jgi:hypothetical protein
MGVTDDGPNPAAAPGVSSPPTVWALPWACPDCKAWGYVGVCPEHGRRTTDEQAMRWVGAKHREQSSGCLRAPERFLLGRLRRREKPTAENPQGKLIFMLGKGEDRYTPIDPRWPIFDRTRPG